MKIGILYICTGKYKMFWKDFYLTCEKNFIPEIEKHYFVFTDSNEIEFEKENKNITRIYQDNLGWPNNTLKRYEVFLKSKELIKQTDFLFYLNANLLFLEKITVEEFLPKSPEKLVGCLHPGYFNKPAKKYTYETNRKSTAFLDNKNSFHYYAGGINGGETNFFLQTIETLDKNIKEDLKNGIIAKWHDESHWNNYLNKNQEIVKTISPSYLYPEGALLPFKQKILIRDKNILGGHSSFRNKTETRLVLNKIKNLIKKTLISTEPTKIIKIQGGLGNQMFQYAYGRKLECFDKKIVFDISFFEKNKIDTPRGFKLNNFKINTKAKFTTTDHYLKNILNKIKSRIGLRQEMFFQNENYFVEISEIIRDEFTLKNPLGDEAQKVQDKILSTQNSVSLHIRRGDYVNNSETNNYHGTCSLEYYQKAIEIIKNKIGNDICIFVFSDDIEWSKNNLKSDSPTEYVSNPEIQDYEEMILMSKCSHNIIANSTFSWWGAWLNQNPNKIVIAPQKWFNNQRENSNNKIVPDSWIKI